MSGFRATGIWPLNMNWTEEKADILAHSLLFYKSAPTTDDNDNLDEEWEEAIFDGPEHDRFYE